MTRLFFSFFFFDDLLRQILTFDVKILINDAVCAFEGDMAETECINLIICFFLVKPNSKSADLRFLLQLGNEGFMILHLFSYFRNVALHLRPDVHLQLLVDLFTQFDSLCLHVLIDLQLVAVVENQVIIVPKHIENEWRVPFGLW